VAPLGISSALAGVAQSRIVSTGRGSEVVSDATNVLALEAARRRRAGAREVHVAASHRVLRAQQFRDSSASAHFRLFNLVSSTRDRGSGTAQAALLLGHLGAWAHLLDDALPDSVPWSVDFTVFRPGPVSERLRDTVLPALARSGVHARDGFERTGADYYSDVALKIHVGQPGEEVELGDGGLTDWTAQLLNDAKERSLISCIATERLAAIACFWTAIERRRPSRAAHSAADEDVARSGAHTCLLGAATSAFRRQRLPQSCVLGAWALRRPSPGSLSEDPAPIGPAGKAGPLMPQAATGAPGSRWLLHPSVRADRLKAGPARGRHLGDDSRAAVDPS
jgi:hypothetical protein